jgi:hypothetical protein
MISYITLNLIKQKYEHLLEDINLLEKGYPVIYLTEKIENKESEFPLFYIGSNYYHDDNYLGSSKKLKLDIKKLGKSSFKKTIIFVFKKTITKKELRLVESDIQKIEKVKEDPKFYNLSDDNGPAMPKNFYVGDNRTDKMKIHHNNLSKYTGENRTEAQKNRDIYMSMYAMDNRTEEQKKSDRSFDISINKMVMLKRTIESNFFNSKYFYFIDAGLSSSSLFPNKYLPNQTDPIRKYYECSLFSPKVSKNLLKLALEDKMVLWKISQWTNYIAQEHCTNHNGNSIIAGIFGSSADTVKKYADNIIEKFISIIETDKTLYLEEPIMTILYQENSDRYKTVDFDVWYHENSGDVFQPMIVNKKSFFNTFEELNQ